MKTKKILETGCLFLLMACSSEPEQSILNEDLSHDILFTAVENPSKEVTPSRAASVASKFMNRPVSRAAGDKIETVTDASGFPTMYVINFSEGGYVIISASTDYYPVLAYSDSGQFDLKQTGNSGAGFWLEMTGNIISHADELSDSIKTKSRLEWNLYDYNQEVYDINPQSRGETEVYDMIAAQVWKWQSEGYTVYNLGAFKETSDFRSMPQDVQQGFTERLGGQANSNYGGYDKTCFVIKKRIANYTTVGPLLTTYWGQHEPFNYYVPNKKALGCTTVAVGQIMYYHRYPTRFNWSAMMLQASTIDSEIEATAGFLYELGRNIGIDYDVNSVADLQSVYNSFRNYGYKGLIRQNHNISTILNSLDNKRPVYMRGEAVGTGVGHAWVCDGYQKNNSHLVYELWVLEDCPDTHDPEIFLNLYNYTTDYSYSGPFFHYNWGQTGYDNGYFSDSSPTCRDKYTQESNTFNINRQELLIAK